MPAVPGNFPCRVAFGLSARSRTRVVLEIQACAAEGGSPLGDHEILNSYEFSGLSSTATLYFGSGGGVSAVALCSEEVARPGDSFLWLHVVEMGFASAGGIRPKVRRVCAGLEKRRASLLCRGNPGEQQEFPVQAPFCPSPVRSQRQSHLWRRREEGALGVPLVAQGRGRVRPALGRVSVCDKAGPDFC